MYVAFSPPAYIPPPGTTVSYSYSFSGATFGTSLLPNGMFNVGFTTVTCYVTVIDPDGPNISTNCTFTIEVYDDQMPVAACQDVTVYLDNFGHGTLTATNINGGSTDNCVIYFSIPTEDENWYCDDVGEHTVVLTVEDQGLNTATCEATVTVEDTIPPTPVCQSVTVYLNDSGFATVTATGIGTNISTNSTDNCEIERMWLSRDTFYCADVCYNLCFEESSPLKSAQAPPASGSCPTVWLYVLDVNGNIDQ